MRNYEYYAKILEVTDGDTLKLEIDFGFYIKYTLKGRLAGINAPEGKNTEAAAFLRQQLPVGTTVFIKSEKVPEKYGRWLITVYSVDILGTPGPISYNVQLVEKELVSVYRI